MQNDTIKNLGTKNEIWIGSGPFEHNLGNRKLNFNYTPIENKTMENKKYIAPFDDYGFNKGDILTLSMDGTFYITQNNFKFSKKVVEAYFQECIEPKKLITMEDIVVGKTVLVRNSDKYEYLVGSKQGQTIIVFLLRDITIEEINENFTIKQI